MTERQAAIQHMKPFSLEKDLGGYEHKSTLEVFVDDDALISMCVGDGIVHHTIELSRSDALNLSNWLKDAARAGIA